MKKLLIFILIISIHSFTIYSQDFRWKYWEEKSKNFKIPNIELNKFPKEYEEEDWISLSLGAEFRDDKSFKFDYKKPFLKRIVPRLVLLKEIIKKKDYYSLMKMTNDEEKQFTREFLASEGHDVEDDKNFYKVWRNYLVKKKKINGKEGLLKFFVYTEDAKTDKIHFHVTFYSAYKKENTYKYFVTIFQKPHSNVKIDCIREFYYELTEENKIIFIPFGFLGDREPDEDGVCGCIKTKVQNHYTKKWENGCVYH
jgi:hypothetical protein